MKFTLSHTILVALAASLIPACAQAPHSVIAATGTVIGVDFGQDASSGVTGTLGYNRTELAIVPTNRSKGDEAGDSGNGAADTADVLMELRYQNIFSGEGGIYQRLAVGKTAVIQPGAALMFARAPGESLNPGDAAAITAAVSGMAVSKKGLAESADLGRLYASTFTDTQADFDLAATASGYSSFSAFLNDDSVTDEQTSQMQALLQRNGVIAKSEAIQIYDAGNAKDVAALDKAVVDLGYADFDAFRGESGTPAIRCNAIRATLFSN